MNDYRIVELARKSGRGMMTRHWLDLESFSEPTEYRGVMMRSRLEAKQAARMDLHGWPWKYEPERFYSKDDTYLPDFWLDMGKGVDCYLECKGAIPDDLEAVLKRMEIIWETKPDAFLSVLVDQCGGLLVAHGSGNRHWRWG